MEALRFTLSQQLEPDENEFVYTVAAEFPTITYRAGIPAAMNSLSLAHRLGSFETLPEDARGIRAVVAHKTKENALRAYARNNEYQFRWRKMIWIYELHKTIDVVDVPPPEGGKDDPILADRVVTTGRSFSVNRIAFVPRSLRELALLHGSAKPMLPALDWKSEEVYSQPTLKLAKDKCNENVAQAYDVSDAQRAETAATNPASSNQDDAESLARCIQQKPELLAQVISLLLREEIDSELAPAPKRRAKDSSTQYSPSVFDDTLQPSTIEGSPQPVPVRTAQQWEEYAASHNLAYLPSTESLWNDDLGEVEILEPPPAPTTQRAPAVTATRTSSEGSQVPEALPDLPTSFPLDELAGPSGSNRDGLPQSNGPQVPESDLDLALSLLPESFRGEDVVSSLGSAGVSSAVGGLPQPNAPPVAVLPESDLDLALSILPESFRGEIVVPPLGDAGVSGAVGPLPTPQVPAVESIPESDLDLALSILPESFRGEDVISQPGTSGVSSGVTGLPAPNVPAVEIIPEDDLDLALSILPESFRGETIAYQPGNTGVSHPVGVQSTTKAPTAEELLRQLPSVPQNNPSGDRNKAASSRSRQSLPKQCCPLNSRKRDCIPCPQLKGEASKPKGDARQPAQKFTPQSFKELAKTKAQEEFRALAKRLNLPSMETVKAMAKLREDFNLRIPSKIKAWINKASPGIFLIGASLPFYITDVVETFRQNSTDLEKAAAATAIFPILGCSTRLASELEKGEAGVILGARISLCYAADLLLFTPAFPVAIMLHVLSSSMSGLQLLDPEYVKMRRDEAWDKHYQNIIDHYTSKEWDAKIESWYLDEMTNISVTISEERGTLAAVEALARLQPDDSDAAPAELEAGRQYNATERTFCNSLRSSRRQLERGLPGATWLSAQATGFNNKYIGLYESQAAVHHRMTPEKHRYVSGGMPMLWVPSGTQRMLDRQFRSKIDPVVETLNRTVMDHVKLDEFVKTVQSRTLKVMPLPSECACSVNIDEIESAGVKTPPEVSDEQLKQTLLCAASMGYNDIIEKLITWSIDLSVRDEDGNTPLILAVKNGYEDTAQLLLKLQDAIWTGETLPPGTKASEAAPEAAAEPPQGSPSKEWMERNKKSLGVRNLEGVNVLEMAQANGLDKVVELIQRATGDGMTSGAVPASS
ncbi:hypothetical protein CP532_0600 [Ophiocordyceps camponoti-leonardi (nom. inval.)]|nr:hypothetical protein CP532_0600 [Ophiocordyceps camponoti-leonardi (nom. inval.)]